MFNGKTNASKKSEVKDEVLLQREGGTSLIYFHEHAFQGTHRIDDYVMK